MKKRNILLLFLSVFSATLFAQNVKISEELNYLNYLMSDAYAGYDDNVEAGIDIPKLISNVQERYENLAQDNEKINQELFAQCIDEGLLRNVVPDNHLYLTLNNKSYGVTSNHYQYSFVFIEKKNNKYIVNYSLEDNVRKGSEYTGSIENLFLEYDNKGEYYRLGILSPKREEYLETSFNNCTVQIPLYTDAVIQKQNWIGTKHTDKTFYISIGDFVLNTGDAVKYDQQLLTLKKYLSEIQKKEYENIVIDIRGNSGGIENNALPILFAIDSATTYIQQQKFTQKIRT